MATYPINASDMLEFQIVGQLHGQTTRNVFHYRSKTGNPTVTDGASAIAALIANFQAGVVASALAFQSNQLTITAITGQLVSPTRYRLVSVVPIDDDAHGSIDSPAEASAVSAVVSLFCSRAGAMFQGRKFFPGVPISFVTNSQLNDTGMGELVALASTLANDMTTAGATFEPNLAKRTGGNSGIQTVLTATPRRILRYQRRREVGKGE